MYIEREEVQYHCRSLHSYISQYYLFPSIQSIRL